MVIEIKLFFVIVYASFPFNLGRLKIMIIGDIDNRRCEEIQMETRN